MATFLGTKLLRLRFTRVLLPLLLVATIEAQESSTPTYHTSTSEVRLVFFATDENSRSVEDLHSDDFAVVDNERVIREFRSFTRSALAKLDVIVLIDASESVLPRFQQEIADVVQLISRWPWTPEDNLSVLSFSGTDAHLICSGDCRTAFTADRIVSLRGGGATPLFDAVEIAADLLIHRSQPDAWPVIVLFSDGDDNNSKSSFDGALEKILASGAQVYAIDVGSPGPPSKGTATLQRIAQDSGGRCVPISEGAVTIFNGVMDDLHSARLVTYLAPKSNSDFHAVRILPTHNLNLQFRSRRSYYHHSGSAP
jgi:VWFA-related protein